MANTAWRFKIPSGGKLHIVAETGGNSGVAASGKGGGRTEERDNSRREIVEVIEGRDNVAKGPGG